MLFRSNVAIGILDANIGAYEIWANSVISTIDANVAAANINIATNAQNIATNTTNISNNAANIAAANSAISVLQTQVYANANVASYLTSQGITAYGDTNVKTLLTNNLGSTPIFTSGNVNVGNMAIGAALQIHGTDNSISTTNGKIGRAHV